MSATRSVPSQISNVAVLRHRGAALLWLLLPVLAGCESNDNAGLLPAAAAVSDSARSEVERGPVKFTVEVSPAKPRLSDQPQLTLTLRAERGVRIVKPPFGEALGDFLIRDFDEPPVEVDDQAEIIRQIYTLEPTRAGALTVAPIAVQFYDQRSGEGGKPHTIESEAVTVEVTTMLGDQAPTLAELRPLADPIELPAQRELGWLLGLVFFAALAIAAVIVRKKRRRQLASEPQLSPQELAWLELEQIIERKLAETDVKEFYGELTGVVRRYIERQMGVHAPEQTTEEFLREIVADDLFVEEERQRLGDFLESADLVKFAAFHPVGKDIEASFERAKEFIRLKRCRTPEVAA